MTPTLAIHAVQILSALCLAFVVAHNRKPLMRIWRDRSHREDAFGAISAFFGLDQIGFTLRWLIWPRAIPTMTAAELSTWLALYVGSALAAVALLVFSRGWRIRTPVPAEPKPTK